MEWRTKNRTGAFKWNKKKFPFNNSLKILSKIQKIRILNLNKQVCPQNRPFHRILLH